MKLKDTKKIQMVINDLKSIKRTVKNMERDFKELKSEDKGR